MLNSYPIARLTGFDAEIDTQTTMVNDVDAGEEFLRDRAVEELNALFQEDAICTLIMETRLILAHLLSSRANLDAKGSGAKKRLNEGGILESDFSSSIFGQRILELVE